LTSATPVPTAVPKDEVNPIPVRVRLLSPVSVSDPRDEERPLPVALTGAKLFHAPEFQVCRPPSLDSGHFLSPYAILKIAAVASAAGNDIVNVPDVEVFNSTKNLEQRQQRL